MPQINWTPYPRVAADEQARTWVQIVADLGKSPHTVYAYARGLNAFLAFCAEGYVDPASGGRVRIDPVAATRAHIAGYVNALRSLPGVDGAEVVRLDSRAPLSNSTLQQRLTTIRLWFDYLRDEGVRADNPVGRGIFTRGGTFGAKRGLVPRVVRPPWIPSEGEWLALVTAARTEPLRNRVMFALQYEGALRREELVGLGVRDIEPAHRVIAVRPETSKGKTRGRTVTYTPTTGRLYAAYLHERRRIDPRPGPLFLSHSNRNRAQAVSVFAWDKVVRRIRTTAGVPRFTTHTPRHLCLTDLARAGWGLKELAEYAGHANPQTTLIYIHLSGRDLVHKYARSQQRREAQLAALAEALA